MVSMTIKHINQRLNGFFSITEEGYRVYKKIKRKYGENICICVSQHPGLGDSYLAGLYLNNYYDREFVVTAMGKGSASVYKYLGIKNICMLDEHETNRLIQFCHFAGIPQEEVRILHHQALLWNTGIAWNLQGMYNTTFADLFEAVVFPGAAREDRSYPSIVRRTDKEMQWEKEGIKKGDTIILFPETNTLSSPPKQFWEELVQSLSHKYEVIVTYSTHKSGRIKGTKHVYEEIDNVVNLAQYAGTIVGARNGLMDILGIADCKKIILYPQMGAEDWIAGKPLEYWSIKNFGYCNDAVELEWNERNLQEIKERIVLQC